MRFVRLLLAAVAALAPASGWCQHGRVSDPQPRNAQLRALVMNGSPDLVAAIRTNYAAIAGRDTSTLRGALADDFRWVLATGGQVLTKPQLLAAIARAPSAARVTYGVDSAHVEIAGPVAMVDYRLTDHRRFGGYDRALVSRGTDTFIRRDGRWRLSRRTQTWIVSSPATIVLDSMALRAFVGRYEHGAGFIDDVRLEGGQLVATSSAESASGLPGARLLPVSAAAFSPDGIAPLIVFERDAVGRVTGYVQQSPDGSVVRARRLPAAEAEGAPSGGRHPTD